MKRSFLEEAFGNMICYRKRYIGCSKCSCNVLWPMRHHMRCSLEMRPKNHFPTIGHSFRLASFPNQASTDPEPGMEFDLSKAPSSEIPMDLTKGLKTIALIKRNKIQFLSRKGLCLIDIFIGKFNCSNPKSSTYQTCY